MFLGLFLYLASRRSSMLPTKPTYRILFYISILALGLYSCSRDKNNSSTNTLYSSEQNDSISFWIQQGKDSDFSEKMQKIAFQKAYGQIQKISLDSVKTKYLSQLSLATINFKDSLLFKRINEETIAQAQKTNDSVVLAEAHWDRAEYYNVKAIPDSSFYHFYEAQKIYEGLKNNYYSGRMMYNMAVSQKEVKDFTGSEITTIRAIELLKPLEKNRQLYLCYNHLGNITQSLKEYDRALEYYRIAEGYLKELEKREGLERSLLNNIGMVYQSDGQDEEAIPYFKKVLEYDSLRYINPQLYAKAMNNLAYSRYRNGDKTAVESQLKMALGIQDSIDDTADKSITQYFLADYYLGEKDSMKALATARKAKLSAELSSNNERLLETLQLLTRIDPKNATGYTQEYITLNDELQEQERQARNKFARIRFETDEFIAENEELEEEKQVLTNQKQIWTGLALGALFFSVFVYVLVDQRRKNQRLRFQKAQQAANQEIFNLMLSQQQKVEEGKKGEQKRISEELHDAVLGKMNGIRMLLIGLGNKSDETAIKLRDNALEDMKKVQDEIREISHELSHAAYRHIPNFINSIQSLLNTTEEASKVKTTFTHDEMVDWDGLTGDIKINLYRIIQESVQNALKHAQCKNIVINFGITEDDLRILVTDDGIGFEVRKRKKGIGMRNISSRVKKMNGSWFIESKKGKGTTLQLTIPIEYHSPELNEFLKKQGIHQSS
ncbi:tetratricopeptide repeat-containing sensor histidine kinase [Maribacter halichondriae]|uniref:tetratricopeptide repeat-containing sensor histidine kinase n=1 Tax=Maribacter halichondriae TaxID=2980554 RepID=UPI00235A198F|nr:sensor histidine kinase [Maribacter sp. Hal144]